MKHLILSLSIISSLLVSGTLMATELSTNTNNSSDIDTVVVVSPGYPTNFEVYSVDIVQSAINESVELMLEDFSDKIVKGNANTISNEASASSAI